MPWRVSSGSFEVASCKAFLFGRRKIFLRTGSASLRSRIGPNVCAKFISKNSSPTHNVSDTMADIVSTCIEAPTLTKGPAKFRSCQEVGQDFRPYRHSSRRRLISLVFQKKNRQIERCRRVTPLQFSNPRTSTSMLASIILSTPRSAISFRER